MKEVTTVAGWFPLPTKCEVSQAVWYNGRMARFITKAPMQIPDAVVRAEEET